MVQPKAAPKRKTPGTVGTFYGHHAAYKKSNAAMNQRTGGRLGVGKRTGGFTGIELKFFDTNFIGEVDSTLANAIHEDLTVLCLSSPKVGTGEQQRVGRKILVTHLQINGYYEIRLETQPEETANVFTIWIVKDKQTNRQQMNALEYLKGGAPTTQAPNTMFNLQWRDRFETLYKRTFHISAPSYDADTATFGSAYVPINMSIDLNCPVTFASGAGAVDGTVSTVSDNSLHLLVSSNRDNVGGHAQLYYTSRIRYVDV